MTALPSVAERMRDEIERGLASYVAVELQGGLARYMFDRVRPGGFLQAVLRNDLLEAVNRMEPGSYEVLRGLTAFLYNFAPANSWGSAERVEKWLADGAEGQRP